MRTGYYPSYNVIMQLTKLQAAVLMGKGQPMLFNKQFAVVGEYEQKEVAVYFRDGVYILVELSNINKEAYVK